MISFYFGNWFLVFVFIIYSFSFCFFILHLFYFRKTAAHGFNVWEGNPMCNVPGHVRSSVRAVLYMIILQRND